MSVIKTRYKPMCFQKNIIKIMLTVCALNVVPFVFFHTHSLGHRDSLNCERLKKVTYSVHSQVELEKINKAKKCFLLKKSLKNLMFYDDIMNKPQPTGDRTIFFHETSCAKDGLISLSPK